MAEQEVLTSLELVSTIVKWLRFITLEEEGIIIAEDRVSELPRGWTGAFAGLARVNRAFFHVSIEVLWERMDSLTPLFGYILPGDKDKDGRPLNPLVSCLRLPCFDKSNHLLSHRGSKNTRSHRIIGIDSNFIRQK
jgi:hypothetical protein